MEWIDGARRALRGRIYGGLAVLLAFVGVGNTWGGCPVAADGVVYVNANQAFTFVLPVGGGDADFTTVLGAPAMGTVTRVSGTTATVVYTPVLNYYGPDSFTYLVHGAEAECSQSSLGTIQVNPCATAGDATVDLVEKSVTFDLPIAHAQSGFNLDELPLLGSGILELVPGSTHTVKFTPEKLGFNGQVLIPFSINTVPYANGACGKSEGSVLVRVPVPEAGDSVVYADARTSVTLPVPITNPGYSLELLDIVTQHGTAVWTGNLTSPTIEYKYTPKHNAHEVITYTVAYRPKYKGTSLRVMITGEISLNPCAVAEDLERRDTDAVQTFDLPIQPGVPFTLDIGDPANGQVSLVENTTATVTYVKDDLFRGVDSFTYTIYYLQSKGGCGPDSGTVTIDSTVQKLSCPVASDGVGFTSEHTSVTIQLPIDGKPQDLAYTQPVHGIVTVPPFSKFDRVIYTPNAGYTGTDEFTYTVSGTLCGDSTAGVTVGVAETNACPTAADVGFELDRGTSMTQSLVGQIADTDDNAYTVWLSSLPVHGTASVTADGTLQYSADAEFVGLDAFTYKVSDGNCSAEGIISATVTAGDDAAVPSWKTYGK